MCNWILVTESADVLTGYFSGHRLYQGDLGLQIILFPSGTLIFSLRNVNQRIRGLYVSICYLVVRMYSSLYTSCF